MSKFPASFFHFLYVIVVGLSHFHEGQRICEFFTHTKLPHDNLSQFILICDRFLPQISKGCLIFVCLFGSRAIRKRGKCFFGEFSQRRCISCLIIRLFYFRTLIISGRIDIALIFCRIFKLLIRYMWYLVISIRLAIIIIQMRLSRILFQWSKPSVRVTLSITVDGIFYWWMWVWL